MPYKPQGPGGPAKSRNPAFRKPLKSPPYDPMTPAIEIPGAGKQPITRRSGSLGKPQSTKKMKPRSMHPSGPNVGY